MIMSQEFLRLKRLTKKYQDDVWKLLSDADGEFIPPLSSREKTTQAALLPGKGDARGPVSYFEQMIRQAFILAVKDAQWANHPGSRRLRISFSSISIMSANPQSSTRKDTFSFTKSRA